MIKKILLYGGAFNPPHTGHQRLLAAAIEAVEPDLTLVTPSEVSPHKGTKAAPFFDRMYMSRVFLDCGGAVKISGMERSGRRRKSYTVKTVKRLRDRYPGAEIFLLIGSDMLFSFDEWHLYRRLLSMVTLVAAPRNEGDRAALKPEVERIARMGGRVLLLDITPMELASTELRNTLRANGDTKGKLDPFVANYAKKRKLY